MASRVWWTGGAALAGALLWLGSTSHAGAQWRDTEAPPSRTSTSSWTGAYDADAPLPDPTWMRRVRVVRRLGGVLLGIGGVVIVAGEAAFARGGSINAVFATDVAGSVVGAVGLFTIVGAQVRRRRVRIHLGLREPIPEHRIRRRRIGGGILLGLVGVVVGGTILRIATYPECGDYGCEGSAALVIIPSSLSALFTVGGTALLTAGRAARFPANRRVRISVGASRGVPTLTAQF